MSSETQYWKKWFDDQARQAQSDYSLNRGTSLRFEELERRSLAQFMQAVAPKSTDVVLDAGCGSGRNISLLSPLVKEIVGIDFSEQMLDRAKEKVASEKLSNVTLHQGTVTQLTFPNNSFDKVICASVLQYLDDKDCAASISEMLRVCKPGGTLVLHVKNGTSLYGTSIKLARKVSSLLGRKVKPEIYRSRSWHERAVANAGGKIVDCDGFGFLTFVPCPNAIVKWLLWLEMNVLTLAAFKKLAVNYKITVRAEK